MTQDERTAIGEAEADDYTACNPEPLDLNERARAALSEAVDAHTLRGESKREGVEAYAQLVGRSGRTVWRWLSGSEPVPAWLYPELEVSEPDA